MRNLSDYSAIAERLRRERRLDNILSPREGTIMLVLSRKTNDAILIGDEITIKIIEIRGGSVRIGIDAPKEVGILRSELLLDLSAVAADSDVASLARSDCDRTAELSMASGI